MNSSTLLRIQKLLDGLKKLPQVEEPEQTIFSIGSRGYYENPTTDILAFFCDTSAAHGLDSLVLTALLDCLQDKFQSFDPSLIESPQREVHTVSGKRIDLLLESQDWVLVIENKIFHHQNNPFSEYERFVKEKRHGERFKHKKVVYVVLSPSGNVTRSSWFGISYTNLIASIKEKLADHFINQPMNKWTILLREFTLHLESIMNKPTLPQENIDFVLNNLSDFKDARKLQEQAIKALQQSLQQELQELLGQQINTTITTWHDYPAIRFAYSNWNNKSDVVLFLDGRDKKSFCINYYSEKITNGTQRAVSDKHYIEHDTGKPWNEVKDTCRCYKAHFDAFDQDSMRNKLAHKLTLMDKFETEIRTNMKG